MLKSKIQRKEKTIGTLINLNDVAVSRIIGLAGYDFAWMDLEHSYMSLESLMAHVFALHASGTAVVVRVPQDDLTFTKKVLEMGVDGVIFPMVRSAKQAQSLVENTLYPPYGTRGFGPMAAIDFGFKDAKEYVQSTKDNVCRFIQIEHVDIVNELDVLIKNEYIDGYIFGPNDLSGSINEMLHVFGEHTETLIKECIKKLRAAGKYIGLATGDTSQKTLEYWRNMGIDMITAGADYAFLKQAAVQTKELLEKLYK